MPEPDEVQGFGRAGARLGNASAEAHARSEAMERSWWQKFLRVRAGCVTGGMGDGMFLLTWIGRISGKKEGLNRRSEGTLLCRFAW
eukprot:scaffold144235_cov23-Tisochrysis_lutea.AAC.1